MSETQTVGAEVNEAKLIRRILTGAKDEFRHLLERYQDQVFPMIMKQVHNRKIAEELTQETFLKAFLNLKNFRGEAKFSTWLSRISFFMEPGYFPFALLFISYSKQLTK